ncbi:AraC family transcriptional regulator, partial [Escherichia sp. TWPC-MK]
FAEMKGVEEVERISEAFKHKFGYAPSAVLKNTDQHPTDASPHN